MNKSQDHAGTTVPDDTQGMSYLNRLPRRVVTIYLPLALFVFVLLFPFYWMAITAVKPNAQLTDYQNYSPFWVVDATFDHIKYLLFETSYPGWLWNTMLVATAATIISLVTSILIIRHKAHPLRRYQPHSPISYGEFVRQLAFQCFHGESVQ